LQFLDWDECIALLKRQEVGRVAFVHDGLVEVLPVNYVLDDGVVVFATAVGTKLWNLERSPVTFEVDEFDRSTRAGWSVVLHGAASVVSPLEPGTVLEHLDELPIEPWAGGDRPHLVRIVPAVVTGRTLER
jgi:nitroimidazol reductase NimA-like FMN-containing flavoprotein (pyridoxamine 5'-phosphate oxidase superfamily)